MYTVEELRITLVGFAIWLSKGAISDGREVDLVNQFLQETEQKWT